MRVLLYRVGRNLNRAYRTCEAFGVPEMLLYQCDGARLSGNLYRATGRVQVREVVGWPDPYKTLALETRYDTPVWDVDWSRVETLIIGGETSGLPARVPAAQTAVIPMAGLVSGLTVEAALAIALHEWGRWRRGK